MAPRTKATIQLARTKQLLLKWTYMGMTKRRAKEILLEQQLREAYHTIEFLHGCLTDRDGYRYEYPEQTEKHLKDIRELIKIPQSCHHSRHVLGCDSCEGRYADGIRQTSARKALGL